MKERNKEIFGMDGSDFVMGVYLVGNPNTTTKAEEGS